MLKIILLVYLYYILIILADNLESEYILCKNCGQELFLTKDLVYVKSPLALSSRNDSHIFHLNNQSYKMNSNSPFTATIQLLENPHGNQFEIITVSNAKLMLLNDTRSIQDTWFPNYYWTICVCPHCLTHIGWYFDSIKEKTSFFGIIIDKLLNENYVESLVLQPKLKLY